MTLKKQAKKPITNPMEMGMSSHDAVVEKISKISEYKSLFKTVFKTDKITIDHIVQAIASFERTLIILNTPFDRFIAGESGALSDSAKRGWVLFQGKGRCITCHEFNESYPFFTDNKFHNVGVAMNDKGFEDLALKAASSRAGHFNLLYKKNHHILFQFLLCVLILLLPIPQRGS